MVKLVYHPSELFWQLGYAREKNRFNYMWMKNLKQMGQENVLNGIETWVQGESKGTYDK